MPKTVVRNAWPSGEKARAMISIRKIHLLLNLEKIVKQLISILLLASIGFAQNDSVFCTIVTFPGKTKSDLFNSIVNWAITNNYEEKNILPKTYEGLTGFALAGAMMDEERKSLIVTKDQSAGLIVLKGSAKITRRWLRYTMAISVKDDKVKIEYPNNISKADISDVKSYLNLLSNKLIAHIKNDNW